MCFQEEASPMEFPQGFNETTIREMSRVALHIRARFPAPDGPGVGRNQDSSLTLPLYRLIGR